MRAERPDLAVITMSGYSTETPGLESIAHRRLRFIQKPFGVERVAREVQAALSETRFEAQEGAS